MSDKTSFDSFAPTAPFLGRRASLRALPSLLGGLLLLLRLART